MNDTERPENLCNAPAPDYSVIMPAYNETAWLDRSLDALETAMAGVDLVGEVIVVDNNSTDETGDIARGRGVQVVFEGHNQIARARNAGAARARGRYLVFLDADTLIPEELLARALNDLEFRNCCGGGVVVHMDRDMTWLGRLFLGLWTWISKRFKLAAGCFVYCLREGFEAVDGFPEKVYAGEEVWFSRALGRWGRRRGMAFHVIEDVPIVTSSRKLDQPASAIATVLLLMVFPWATRFRPLCWLWYRREK